MWSFPRGFRVLLAMVAAIGSLIHLARSASGGVISAGYYHTCGIASEGALHCWGSNIANQSLVPEKYVRFQVHSNLTKNNNSWSTIYDFQMENGSMFNFSDPELVERFWLADGGQDAMLWVQIQGWAMVSAGYSHTCGITDLGTLLCWGQGKNGQALVPQWIMGSNDTAWASVSAGTSHTCAISSNGTGVCWGADDEGQSTVPEVPGQTWRLIDAGYAHTCGIVSNGSAICWGWNGVVPGTLVPFGQARVPSSVENWTMVSAGFVHTCGVSSTGEGFCWGKNDNGQGDVPEELEESDPGQVYADPYQHLSTMVPARWLSIQASYFHSCGITTSSRLVCWGTNDAGQAEVPRALVTARQLTVGFVHGCVVNASGFPVCWGPAPTGDQAYWYQGQATVPSSVTSWKLP